MQPVFDPAQLEIFFNRIRDIAIPFLAGIMPLTSYKAVEFLNNEVPGVTIPQAIIKRMAAAESAASSRAVGIEIAQQSIEQIRAFAPVQGLYLMPPFSKDKYEIALEVLSVLR